MCNSKNILIVIAQFNKMHTDRLLESLQNVDVPSGYDVEVAIITNAAKCIDAYREATLSSEAKYKIYLNEKIVIKNSEFLHNIIDTFKSDDKIGAIGAVGSKIIPPNGEIRNNLRRIGELQFQDIKFSNWIEEQNNSYDKVLAIEEYIFATQYDTSWMDIGLKNNEFLFTTQCVELKKLGFISVVDKELAKTIYYNGVSPAVHSIDDSKIFLDKYYQDVLPLVQVLIPTYNRPDLLKIALESALSQTYRNIEIIISDNNDNNEATYNMLKPYIEKDNRIKYFHQKGKGFGINEQFIWLKNYDNPKAEYVSWLMDDDIYYPDKISIMINYYLQYDGISIVTSMRDFIDINGDKYEINALNKAICTTPTRFSGNEIGRDMLMSQFNFIGEPTTVLLKKSYLTSGNIGWDNVEGEYVIIDFPRWLELMTKGDLIYIPTPLSALRVHSVRDSSNRETQLNICLCWLLDIKYAWNNKIFITNENDYKKTILLWLKNTISKIVEFNNIGYDTPRLALLKKAFSNTAESLCNGYNLNLDILNVNNEK